MGKVIGIDLGTTNSLAAVLDGPMPRALDNREGKTLTRSVVGLFKRRGKKGEPPPAPEIVLSDVALDNFPAAPRDTILSIKRLMGRAVADAEVQRVRQSYQYAIVEPTDGNTDSVRVVMGGKQYSPEDLSAMILEKLKDDAEF